MLVLSQFLHGILYTHSQASCCLRLSSGCTRRLLIVWNGFVAKEIPCPQQQSKTSQLQSQATDYLLSVAATPGSQSFRRRQQGLPKRQQKQSRPSMMRVKISEKRQWISSILICGPQQPVYCKVWLSCSSVSTRWSLENVCEVKKRLVEPGLVWSKPLSILLSMNRDSVFLPVFV